MKNRSSVATKYSHFGTHLVRKKKTTFLECILICDLKEYPYSCSSVLNYTYRVCMIWFIISLAFSFVTASATLTRWLATMVVIVILMDPAMVPGFWHLTKVASVFFNIAAFVIITSFLEGAGIFINARVEKNHKTSCNEKLHIVDTSNFNTHTGLLNMRSF